MIFYANARFFLNESTINRELALTYQHLVLKYFELSIERNVPQ